MIFEPDDEAIDAALDALSAEFAGTADRAALDAARFDALDGEPTDEDWEALARALAD